MRTVGRYEIFEKVGEGGFAEVFSAMDPALGRKVAIKICTSQDSEQVKRFAQEASLAATLSHRNITATYDFSNLESPAFLVQEFLEGEDLDQKIARREELSFTTKLLYLIQLARGLSHAHSRGVVHRDVKPSNVRILPNGQVKLMDFGIARAIDDDDHLTLAGETMGTAAYLSPEQVRGERVDERCDIYSFGATAYELLCFERPFPGQDTDDVLRAVVSTPPPSLEEYSEECPASLAKIVARCLEKDREDRYGSFQEILEEFDSILGEDSGQLASRDVVHASRTNDQDEDRTLLLDQPTVLINELPPPSIPTRRGPPTQTPPLATAPQPAATEISSHLGGGASDGKSDSPSFVRLLLGLAGMGILGALSAIWFFGLDSSRPSEQPSESSTDTSATVPPPTANSPAEILVAPSSGTPAILPQTTSPQDASARQPGNAPAGQTALLVLEPAWTPRMTAQVGGQSYLLGTSHDLWLSPGDHTVVFQLLDDPQTGWDESQTERRTVQLHQDRTVTLRSGLQKPGAVTLRAALGTPQGLVRLSGGPLGWTPIDEHLLQPGVYQVEIASSSQATGELSFEITVETGKENIVTFNLHSKDDPRSRIKAWNP